MKNIRDLLRGSTLNRYLESQVGRPWDKVFSDLCSMADLRSRDGYELRRRIGWNVEKECFIGDDGKVYESRMYRRGARPTLVRGLYVHPKTGILGYQKSDSRYGGWSQPRPWEREINYVSTEDGHWFIKDDNGDWYEHWMESKQIGNRPMIRDVETQRYVPDPEAEVKYHTETKERRRELSHREIVKLTTSPNFHLYGTNKDMLSRLYGKYVPASKWKPL